MTKTNNKAGEAMRAAREKRNLSQREVAEMLGISSTEVSDYECGRRTPGLHRAKIIQEQLGVEWTLWA